MFTMGLYISACGFLLVSLIKDRHKTALALKKAWKSLENILPIFLVIILVIGMGLTVLSPPVISKLIGRESGWIGIMLAAVIGSVTLIPGFVTFPLAATLLKSGAGLTPIIVFISTSMMVGVVTIPVEFRYFGKKVALIRNILALLYSFIVAVVLKAVLMS